MIGSALENEEVSEVDDESTCAPQVGFDVSVSSMMSTVRQNRDLRAMDRLWSFCETSSATSKLILPDSLDVPYYLPKSKGHRLRTDEEIAREAARTEYLVRRDASMHARTLGSNTLHLLRPNHSDKLSRKEERIYDKYVTTYLKDESLRAELMERVDHLRRAKQQSFAESQQTLRENQIQQRMPKGTVDKRLSVVSSRRQALVQQEISQSLENCEQWMAQVAQTEASRVHVVIERPIHRLAAWLIVVATMQRLQVMVQVVEEVRKARKLDLKSWNAVICIQRYLRRYLRKRRGGNGSDDHKHRFKLPIGNSQQRSIFQQRQESCTIITRFLIAVSGGWKSIIGGFVRKIKFIQRFMRKHLLVNSYRHLLLSKYLDRILPAVLTHCQVVLADKGHDLRNMTALDISRIRFQLRALKSFHVVADMDSPSFHALLRNHASLVKVISRFFGASAKSYPQIQLDVIKRNALLDLLFRKRLEFVNHLDSFQPKAFQAQAFSVEDVRNFIYGGQDPLLSHLLQVKEEQDSRFAEYLDKLNSAKKYWGRRKREQGEDIPLLLSSLKAEDVGNAFLSACAVALQALESARGYLSKTTSPRHQMTSFSSVVNDDPEEYEQRSSDGNAIPMMLLGGSESSSSKAVMALVQLQSQGKGRLGQRRGTELAMDGGNSKKMSISVNLSISTASSPRGTKLEQTRPSLPASARRSSTTMGPRASKML